MHLSVARINKSIIKSIIHTRMNFEKKREGLYKLNSTISSNSTFNSLRFLILIL